MNSSNYYIIAVIILLLVIIYQFYKYISQKESFNRIVFINDEKEFNEDFNRTTSYSGHSEFKEIDLPGAGHGFAIRFDMYVFNIPEHKQWQSSFNKLKPILRLNHSPNIYYHPKKNYLDIVLKYQDCLKHAKLFLF